MQRNSAIAIPFVDEGVSVGIDLIGGIPTGNIVEARVGICVGIVDTNGVVEGSIESRFNIQQQGDSAIAVPFVGECVSITIDLIRCIPTGEVVETRVSVCVGVVYTNGVVESCVRCGFNIQQQGDSAVAIPFVGEGVSVGIDLIRRVPTGEIVKAWVGICIGFFNANGVV